MVIIEALYLWLLDYLLHYNCVIKQNYMEIKSVWSCRQPEAKATGVTIDLKEVIKL